MEREELGPDQVRRTLRRLAQAVPQLLFISLVLFLLTMIVNAFARILIVVTTRRGTAA